MSSHGLDGLNGKIDQLQSVKSVKSVGEKIDITMKAIIMKILWAAIALMIIGAATVLTSCNVTRTITTTSSSIQRGDTTVIIQSKTIEQYDASKKL